MAYLLLDLDETTIVAEQLINRIHPAHQLSSQSYQALCGYQPINFYIINPELLSDLIQTACTEFDGVIIFTSGFWNQDLRTVLADNLDLSIDCREKLINCPFHSPLTDTWLWDLNSLLIRNKSKGERFEKIMQMTPEYSNKHFVLLDDNHVHTDSFTKITNVYPVIAGTDTADRTFYETAKASLASCDLAEKENCAIETLMSMKTSDYSPIFFSPPKVLKRKQVSEVLDEQDVDTLHNKRRRVDDAVSSLICYETLGNI